MGHHKVKDGELVEAGAIQIWLQSLWARTVGLAVWVFDKLIRYLNNRFGRPILWLIARALDHLIDTSEVVTVERAKDFIDAISGLENPEITVFGCKCQRALGKRKGTYMKCMNVLYGAEAYKTPGHDYRDLTPEEAKALLEQLHEEGLMHAFLACMYSKGWVYGICSCDSEICIEFKAHQVAGGIIFPGPDIVALDREMCTGCGICVERCHFGANSIVNGSAEIDLAKCYGCGVCVSTCSGGARTMVEREGYRNRYYPIELVNKASAHQVAP